MLSTEIQRSVRLNKKKKSTNISPYPDEAIERLARAFYPAILACWNSEEGQREFAAWQAEQAHIATKEKQEVPVGELPALLIVCGFLQGASGWMPPVFVLSESACGLFFWRIIRFNTQHPVADPHMGLNQMQRMCT